MKKILFKVFLGLLSFILVLILAFAGLVGYLWIKEFNPEPTEVARLIQSPNPVVLSGDNELSALSYNIGYAGLGKNQDFFMDGGQMVIPPNAEAVKENLEGIVNELRHVPSDFYLMQEVDEDSRRSYHYNEIDFITRNMDMGYAFAYNYKVPFVPYPLPPLGKVSSGLLTLSPYQMLNPTRIALPVPFKWPVRLANLKRCLLVTRIPIEGSDKMLTLVNLHLEAYDNGEGKIAQTKALRNFLEEEYKKGNYVLAGGDWNQVLPGMPDIPQDQRAEWKPGEIKREDLPQGWTIAVDPKEATSRLDNRPYAGNENRAQLSALDGFLLSPNLELLEVKALNTHFDYSDHRPIQLRFRMKKN